MNLEGNCSSSTNTQQVISHGKQCSNIFEPEGEYFVVTYSLQSKNIA